MEGQTLVAAGGRETILWSGSVATRASADCRHVADARPLFPTRCFRAQGTPLLWPPQPLPRLSRNHSRALRPRPNCQDLEQTAWTSKMFTEKILWYVSKQRGWWWWVGGGTVPWVPTIEAEESWQLTVVFTPPHFTHIRTLSYHSLL